MKSGSICAFDAKKAFGTLDFQRAVKKGRRAMTELVDDAAFIVKKQPLKSVGIAFGVALAIGAVAGRFAK